MGDTGAGGPAVGGAATAGPATGGTVIGDLMIGIEDSWSQAEVADAARGTAATIGWALDPAFGGRGLATEAVDALLRICFIDLGVRRVRADCFTANEPSWRLMERVGMRREAHTVGDALHRSGRWYDGYQYAILAEEWRARHPVRGRGPAPA